MSNAEVVVVVHKDGRCTVEGRNIQGPSCAVFTKPFADALGVVESSTPTAEMFQAGQEEQSGLHHERR